jgi:hypothetical protein
LRERACPGPARATHLFNGPDCGPFDLYGHFGPRTFFPIILKKLGKNWENTEKSKIK